MNDRPQYLQAWNIFAMQGKELQRQVAAVNSIDEDMQDILDQARVVEEALTIFRKAVIKDAHCALHEWVGRGPKV